MQITVNKIAFDLAPVAESLRAALLREPAVMGSARRAVWAWDGAKGAFLVPVAEGNALPLPTGVVVRVARPSGADKAEGPSQRMAERLLAAVGSKGLPQLSQALTRVTGVARQAPPLRAFDPLKERGAFQVACDVDFAVLEMENAARNLQAFLVLPAMVAFAPLIEGGAPDFRRPAFVVQPPTDAAGVLRRMAAAQRLREMQAALGGTKPADLPEGDPRRAIAARLGAEWWALQPKTKAA